MSFDFVSVLPMSFFYKMEIKDTSFRFQEMLNVHDHYQNMKHVISADKSNPDKALSLIKDDFFDNIKNIVLEHQQWHKDRKVCDCLFGTSPWHWRCTRGQTWVTMLRGSLAEWLHSCGAKIQGALLFFDTSQLCNVI